MAVGLPCDLGSLHRTADSLADLLQKEEVAVTGINYVSGTALGIVYLIVLSVILMSTALDK